MYISCATSKDFLGFWTHTHTLSRTWIWQLRIMWQEETKTRRMQKKNKHQRHRSRAKPRKSHSRKRRRRSSFGSRSFLGFAWALFASFYLRKVDIHKECLKSHPTNPHCHSSTKALGQKVAEGAGRRVAAPQEVILFCQQSKHNNWWKGDY